ncbi:MAG: ribokinase [Candidatus Caldarchaeum sp.]
MAEVEVVVVGSIHADLVVKLSRIPRRGETVIGGVFQIFSGGKGANQAVAASRLGVKTSIVGRVGNDLFGSMLVDRLERERVSTNRVVRDSEAHTGVALIMVDQRGSNLIAVASGADERLSPADVENAKEEIASAKLLLLQLEIPLQTVEHAVNLAFQSGVKVLLNPAPARPLSGNVLEKVDVLVPNALEASYLTGVEVRGVLSAVSAGKKLLRKGVKNVLITLGAKGVVLVTERETLHLKGVKVKAVDTTGAGDAFCGALAYALSRNMRIHEAAELANISAALATTKLGAQEAMPTFDELYEFLNSNKKVRNLGGWLKRQETG